MDNLTHILAGLLGAELVVNIRSRSAEAEPDPGWVRVAYLVSAVAQSLPDIDFAYCPITAGRLGYLLHHRGHTHTLLGGAALGLLLFAAAWIWSRRRGMKLSRGDLAWLAVLAVAGPLVHVGMDYSNVYGVHPFWPFDNRWYYGDSIFIVEPVFWAVGVPPLFHAVKERSGKILLGLWVAATVVLPIATRTVALAACAALLVLTAGTFLLGLRCSRARRAIVAATSVAGVLALFVVCGRRADREARDAFAKAFPEERLLDLVSTPLPANPACWQAIAVQAHPAGRYALRRARVSLLSKMFPAASCTVLSSDRTTAPLAAVALPGTESVRFDGEWVERLDELRTLAERSCEARAFLRFARAPFWVESQGRDVIVGDLRFDRSPEIEFSEMALGGGPCPRFVPSWVPPRSDLLGR